MKLYLRKKLTVIVSQTMQQGFERRLSIPKETYYGIEQTRWTSRNPRKYCRPESIEKLLI